MWVFSGLRRVYSLRNQPEERRSQRPMCQYCAAVHSELDLPSTGRASFDKSHLYWSQLYRYTMTSQFHWIFIQRKLTFLLSHLEIASKRRALQCRPTRTHACTRLYFDYIWHNQPKITAEISNFWIFLLSYGCQGTHVRAQNARGLFILPPHLATSSFVWLCVHIISLLRVTHAHVLDRISDQHSIKTT